MLDIKRIRDDPEPFRRALARAASPSASTSCSSPTSAAATLTPASRSCAPTQNRASKAIGAAQGDEKEALIAEVSSVSAELKELEPQLAEAEAALNALLAATPNVPHESAPDGFTDEDAVEVRRNHDEPPAFDFEVRDHAALGRAARRARHRRAARARAARGSST